MLYLYIVLKKISDEIINIILKLNHFTWCYLVILLLQSNLKQVLIYVYFFLMLDLYIYLHNKVILN